MSVIKNHPWQAVFFDFDGVILDSVNVKTKAFAMMFSKYGSEIQQKVINFHVNNGGISRYEKFRYYYENLLGKQLDENTLDELGKEFSDLVLSEVIVSPYMPGAIETLESLKRRNILAFVVSGTPEDEMRTIIKERELVDYFKEVHGSPRKKETIILDLGQRYGLELAHCLFIGDAKTDFMAAKKAGTEFLGIMKDGQDTPFPVGTWVSSKVTV